MMENYGQYRAVDVHKESHGAAFGNTLNSEMMSIIKSLRDDLGSMKNELDLKDMKMQQKKAPVVQDDNRGSGRQWSNVKCFKCKKKGHIAKTV